LKHQDHNTEILPGNDSRGTSTKTRIETFSDENGEVTVTPLKEMDFI